MILSSTVLQSPLSLCNLCSYGRPRAPVPFLGQPTQLGVVRSIASILEASVLPVATYPAVGAGQDQFLAMFMVTPVERVFLLGLARVDPPRQEGHASNVVAVPHVG